MSKHKKQHFIPACYLKAWCDTECPPKQTPYIWVFDVESRGGKRKAPDNVFHENNMYTIWDENGGRDLRIEHGLSELEGVFTAIRSNKFDLQKELDQEDHFLICIFIAAMHLRTRCHLDHISKQWSAPLKIADEMAEKLKNATAEQKQAMAKISSHSSSDNGATLTHEQVRKIVAIPVETMLLPMIKGLAPQLRKLDFAVLYSDNKLGFITSDSPCVWFDPEGYKRPPLYRGPALMYKSIEITFPISPSQCILLNRQGLNGYIKLNERIVTDLNRRQFFHASKSFIVNQNSASELWFDPGIEPEDTWAKEQEKKEANQALKHDG